MRPLGSAIVMTPAGPAGDGRILICEGDAVVMNLRLRSGSVRVRLPSGLSVGSHHFVAKFVNAAGEQVGESPEATITVRPAGTRAVLRGPASAAPGLQIGRAHV